MKIGMGATLFYGSDRYPCTIVEILSSRKIVVRENECKRTDKNGLSEIQTYEFGECFGIPKTFTLRKDGKWYLQGHPSKGQHLVIGHRDCYTDPSF